jgi:hypothetical protein
VVSVAARVQGAQACSGIANELAAGGDIAAEQMGDLVDGFAKHIAQQERQPRQQRHVLQRGLEFHPYAITAIVMACIGKTWLHGVKGVHAEQTTQPLPV